MTRARQAASLSIMLAAGILVAGLLGPLGFGIIRFHMTGAIENQYLGGEIVTLFIVAPALLAAAILWLRRAQLAPVLAFGPAIYTVYTFVTVIMGQEYARMPGNAENAFFLYLALVAGGFMLALFSVSEMLAMPVPVIPSGLRRTLGVVFLALAVLFSLAWVGQALLVYRGDAPTEYADSPALFWLIKLLDLGFLVPGFTLVGAGLIRRNPAAAMFAGGMSGVAFCMVGAVLGMAIAMQVKGDPSASPGIIGVLAPVWVAIALVTARTMLLYRQERTSEPSIGSLTGAGHAST